LEEITRGGFRYGILPNGLVAIGGCEVDRRCRHRGHLQGCMGRLGNELIYRDREPSLEIVESGRP